MCANLLTSFLGPPGTPPLCGYATARGVTTWENWRGWVSGTGWIAHRKKIWAGGPSAKALAKGYKVAGGHFPIWGYKWGYKTRKPKPTTSNDGHLSAYVRVLSSAPILCFDMHRHGRNTPRSPRFRGFFVSALWIHTPTCTCTAFPNGGTNGGTILCPHEKPFLWPSL